MFLWKYSKFLLVLWTTCKPRALFNYLYDRMPNEYAGQYSENVLWSWCKCMLRRGYKLYLQLTLSVFRIRKFRSWSHPGVVSRTIYPWQKSNQNELPNSWQNGRRISIRACGIRKTVTTGTKTIMVDHLQTGQVVCGTITRKPMQSTKTIFYFIVNWYIQLCTGL